MAEGLLGLMQPGPTRYEAERLRKERGSRGLLQALGEPLSYAPTMPTNMLAQALLGAQYLTGEKDLGEGMASLSDMSALAVQGLLGRYSNPLRQVVSFGNKLRRDLAPTQDIPPGTPGVVVGPSGKIGFLEGDMSVAIRHHADGRWSAERVPTWGSQSKKFFGVGDSAQELIDAVKARIAKSDAAVSAAAKRKEASSLLGRLRAEYGDNFSTARSTQSKSEYITHIPSGTKIRISDHPLPLHYEQPDIDLPKGAPIDEMLNEIRRVLG